LQAKQELHLSILRELQYRKKIGGNILVFANKTKDDIILESELKCLLGDSFINILSDENTEGYAHGFITEDFLKANVPLHYKNYYLCGPPLMMESIISQLLNLGIRKDLITMEKM
jgi:NAD(P)H-flavin reductase